MDLQKRLGVPVELSIPEMKSIVDSRVAAGIPHGLMVLLGGLDGYSWANPKTGGDGLPDVQWQASPDRYMLLKLQDEEILAVLSKRVSGVSPDALGIVRNVVTMLEEAQSAFSALSDADRKTLDGMLNGTQNLSEQLTISLASVRLIESAVGLTRPMSGNEPELG